ncbi:MAG: hypothetical protein ABSG71_07150 [Thermodesulfobacteriota bacterium]|jgi:hypothetical protein
MSNKVTSTENTIEGGGKIETRGGDNLKGVRTLEKVQRAIVILVLTFTCLRCSGGAYIGAKNSGSPSNLIDEKVDHPPVLVMGTKFIYQDANLSNGKICNVTMVVKQRKEFDKKPAYWIEVSREERNYFDIYDMNLNWIGSFADGKELESAEPCIRVFKWPLRVGKKWDSSYTLRDYSEGFRPSPSKITVNIRTYEEVTVPAGTFKALRIQAGGETCWYVPSIGWVVKEQSGPYGKEEWLLELVKYSIPHRIAEKERPWKRGEICQ